MLMRAKMRVSKVEKVEGFDQENLEFTAVGRNAAYPEDGSDENNTYARWTPSADLKMAVQNPALFGKFRVGQEFYLHFDPVDQCGAAPVEAGS